MKAIKIVENIEDWTLAAQWIEDNRKLISESKEKIVIDLSNLNYIPSNLIGYFIDIIRDNDNIDIRPPHNWLMRSILNTSLGKII